MKTLSTIIFAFLSILSYGQCTIDYSPTVPGTYPAVMPDGMVGDPYDEDLTILFPADSSGTNYTSFQIISVELPLGLTWECSNAANNCEYNPQQDPFACLHIYGTPAEAGQITVNIKSKAELAGNIEASYTVTSDLEIHPSSKTNSNFEIVPGFGCGTVDVDFSIVNPISYTPVPGQTNGISYSWEFGNGQMSNQENPPTQTYNGAGSYPVTLTEIYDTTGFYMKEVKITSVGCDDAIGFGEPDIYIELIDASNTTVYSTSGNPNDNDLPQTYTMNVQLNNPPYKIRVMDDDSDNWIGTDDDNCINGDENSATTDLSLPNVNQYGTTTQSENNGSLSFTYDISKDTSHVVTVDTVHVFANPSAPIIALDVSNPATVSTPDLGYVYQWNKDNAPMYNANDTLVYLSEEGAYSVIAVDENGCYSESNVENYSTVALQEETKSDFNLYPNPTNTFVNIEFSKITESSKLQVSDLMGRIILSQPVNGKNKVQMDVSNLSGGVYIVTVADKKGNASTKQLVIGD